MAINKNFFFVAVVGLCLLATSLAQETLVIGPGDHQKQDRLKVQELYIVTPKVALDGELIDHLPGKAGSSAPRDRRVRVEVMPGGDRSPVVVDLYREQDLMTGGARMEWVRDNETESVEANPTCLFSGKTLVSLGQVATISLCNGVAGVILKGEDTIYVSPLSEGRVSFSDPHVIRIVPNTRKTNDLKRDRTGHKRTAKRGKSSGGRRRVRRDVDRRPRWIEVLLVVDRSVVAFHGRELVEQYLITQMNIVNTVYHHESLGIVFNVVVVKILMIDSNTADGIVVEENGKTTLDRFCSWVERTQRNSGPEFDVAVFMTRSDIGPAGFAPVTGMCRLYRGCAVVKDDGISSAFVIAHEIGHIFGMGHDGYGNDCDKEPEDGKLMSSMVQSAYDRYYWSSCARDKMEEVISDLHCLDNKPTNTIWPVYSQPYGQSWTLNEQCRQEFGSGYEICTAYYHFYQLGDMDPCQYLWCSHGEDSPTMCKTKRSPPLSGTSCGRGKWCMDGSCVPKSASTRVVVDGGWADWGEWKECSRSCGVGAQLRHRTCTNPRPKHGGNDCKGNIQEHRLCNTQDCAEMRDFRAEQCAAYDTRNYLGRRRHHWFPVENKNISMICKLSCVSRETGDTFTTDGDVTDGTRCSYELPHDICVKGKCYPVGCDRTAYSLATEDHCGVCQGDGSSCKNISGVFRKELRRKEYHNLLVIPAQARNIRIKEKGHTHLAFFIALREPDSERFILNGDARHGHSRQFIQFGTRFVYLRKGDGEILEAQGPLLHNVEVLMYSFSGKLRPKIHYSYTIPNDLANSIGLYTDIQPAEEDRYVWVFSNYTQCTKTCGSGTKYEVFTCVDRQKRTVSKGLCSLFTQPKATNIPCNEQACESDSNRDYWWYAEEWDKCSRTCGVYGVQSRKIHCIGKVEGNDTVMDPIYCHNLELPEQSQPCNRMPCPGTWRAGPWSQCSVTCGSGSMRREVTCEKPRDGNRYICLEEDQPADLRLCDRDQCPDDLEVTTKQGTTTLAMTTTTAPTEKASVKIVQTFPTPTGASVDQITNSPTSKRVDAKLASTSAAPTLKSDTIKFSITEQVQPEVTQSKKPSTEPVSITASSQSQRLSTRKNAPVNMQNETDTIEITTSVSDRDYTSTPRSPVKRLRKTNYKTPTRPASTPHFTTPSFKSKHIPPTQPPTMLANYVTRDPNSVTAICTRDKSMFCRMASTVNNCKKALYYRKCCKSCHRIKVSGMV